MLTIYVFLVRTKENNFISTNVFVVNVMLPIMAKHVDI